MEHQTTSLLSQTEDQRYETISPDDQNQGPTESEQSLSIGEITAILSTAFSYGCVNSTLFLITLPIECERIELQHPIPKSVSLGVFVAIAGITQLVSPLVGMLSDTYKPPQELGQRMPYLVLGSIITTVGLFGQYWGSYENFWVSYGISFFADMVGFTMTYAMMITLIPDQVPKQQTGIANGILALLIVGGSLFGFGVYKFTRVERIQNMYGLYICIVITTTILTGLYAHDRDAALNRRRRNISVKNRRSHRRRHHVILGPWILLKTMIWDPLSSLDSTSLLEVYKIDVSKNYKFFIVTVSRLFYYCGISIQTFFLYFLHDIIHVRNDPEKEVANLAILLQFSGAFICYPVGLASDQFYGGARRPFIYLACLIMGGVMVGMMFASSMHEMIILCSILGAGNGMYLTMETSLAVDALPHTSILDGENSSLSGGDAQLLGIWGVAAFLGSTLGPLIGGPLLYLVGSSSTDLDEGQDYSKLGYIVVLGLSASYFTFSAIALRWL